MGLLKVNRARINRGGGNNLKKNAVNLIKIKPILLFKIKSKKGGKLIAIPVDKRLKIIVSEINFKILKVFKSESELKKVFIA